MKICELCQQEKPLIKRSHIIPDFFYKDSGLYNENHKIHKFNVQEYINKPKIKFIPTGDYEGGILCQECDNELLGTLETYGSKVLFGGLSEKEYITSNHFINSIDGNQYSVFENVDYTRFKLFLLSILWRACISKRSFFKEVELREIDKEKIRLMLINKNAGKIYEYPIKISSYFNDKNVATDIIIQPRMSTEAENKVVTFIMGGFIFFYYLTDHLENVNEYKDFTVTPENKMTIIYIPQGKARDFILRFSNLK
jgi:hypothetical protein